MADRGELCEAAGAVAEGNVAVSMDSAYEPWSADVVREELCVFGWHKLPSPRAVSMHCSNVVKPQFVPPIPL